MINLSKKLSTYFCFLVYKSKSLVTQTHAILKEKPCLLCLQYTSNSHQICSPCLADLPSNDAHCFRCALPLPSNQFACGECISEPPAFTRTICPFVYNFPLDHCLHQLKYSGKRYYAASLAKLLSEKIDSSYASLERPQVLVPVPLSKKKQKDRGFNQSELIANALSKEVGIPVCTRILKKLRDTPSQTGLDKRRRKRNLRGAFAVKDNRYKYIALIDDVVTTRATSESIAKVLLESGVERIDIWCIARTPKSHY